MPELARKRGQNVAEIEDMHRRTLWRIKSLVLISASCQHTTKLTHLYSLAMSLFARQWFQYPYINKQVRCGSGFLFVLSVSLKGSYKYTTDFIRQKKSTHQLIQYCTFLPYEDIDILPKFIITVFSWKVNVSTNSFELI